MEKEALSLHELNLNVRSVIKTAFGQPVWVTAEISELKENRNGHCYLELIEKDDHGSNIKARARGIIWAYTYRMLKPYFETTTGQAFQAGIKVMVMVSVEFHEQYGFSLEVKDIEPAFTLGDIERQKQEIVERLMDEGVFDMNRQTELNLCPQKLAIISSPTAAGFTDFMNQLENNPYGYVFYTRLFPTTMQGMETESSMTTAFEKIYQYEGFFDAVVIIRGGGASIDLHCFNNYNLAYLVTQFPIPVITGIGHEKDETILDLVAFQKLKTPTAVAEFLVDKLAGVESYIDDLNYKVAESVTENINNAKTLITMSGHKLSSLIARIMTTEKVNIERLISRIPRLADRFIDKKQSALQRILQRTSVSAPEKLQKNHELLFKAEVTCKLIVRNYLKTEKLKHQHFTDSLHALSPESILKRGYSISTMKGKPLMSANSVKKGDKIETLLYLGKVKSTVTGTDS